MILKEFGRRLVLDQDITAQKEALVVLLDKGQEVCLEDAALFYPGEDRWEGLCYEAFLGAGDEEGLEDSAVVSRDPEGREVLLELREALDGQSVEAEAEAPFVVYWNRGGEAIAVNGTTIRPGGYMTSRALTGAEAVRRWRLGGGVCV